MAVIVAMLALAPVASAAPPMRIALLVDTSAATASAIVGQPEAIASGLAQVTHGHYASMGIAGNIAEAMVRLAAKLGDDAARRP